LDRPGLPIWLSGAAVVLILVALGMAHLGLDRVTLPPMTSWLYLTADLSRDRPGVQVRVLQATGPAMPMTWGIRRPTILLPAEANAWPLDRRRDVLLHELAHVKRYDFLIQLIARIACAVYWFHPLVWLAATRLREERERACDDRLLRAGAKPSAYATHLLEIARCLRAARATSLASVAMARPGQLATRLIDVLDTQRRRDTLSSRSALPAWIAAIVVVLPLAALAPRVAEPATVTVEPATVKVDTIPRVPAPNVVTGRPAPSWRAARVGPIRCAVARTRRRPPSTHQNDDGFRIVTTGGCISASPPWGNWSSPGFADIAPVSPDGRR
jgi:hypothetical protein